MSARYWVLVSDELMNVSPEWPDGLRVIEAGPYNQLPTGGPTPPRWWLFEDDGAPASLNGKNVQLTLVRSGDKTMIGSREPAI